MAWAPWVKSGGGNNLKAGFESLKPKGIAWDYFGEMDN